jgi:hypothetical protein
MQSILLPPPPALVQGRRCRAWLPKVTEHAAAAVFRSGLLASTWLPDTAHGERGPTGLYTLFHLPDSVARPPPTMHGYGMGLRIAYPILCGYGYVMDTSRIRIQAVLRKLDACCTGILVSNTRGPVWMRPCS